MKKISLILYRFLIKALLGLMAFFALLLIVSAFIFTTYSDNMETQVALIRLDNIPLNLLGMLLFYIIFTGISFFVLKKVKTRKKLLLFIVLGWYLVAGLLLAVFGRTVPAADSMSVYSIAEALARGDTSVIHPTDSYISFYPQQIGLVAFYEIAIRFWNLLNISLVAFHFIKCLNVLFACIMIYMQYQTVHLLFNSDRTDCLYLCLAGANLPLLFYTSFVYGEVPSLTLFFIGLWLMLRLPSAKGKFKGFSAILACLTIGGSVLLRKNMWIPVLAVLILLLIKLLKNRSIPLLGLLMSLLLVSLLLPSLTEKYYEHRSGNAITEGVPPLSYVAMGMQDASRGNGWYNGYNLQTYQKYQMNRDLTNNESIHEIQTRLSQWQAQPLSAVLFYGNKYLTQWADGTYACRQATLATFGGRLPLIQKFYDGSFSRLLIEACNVYQNLLYLGCLLFTATAFRQVRKKNPGDVRTTALMTSDPLLLYGLLAAFGGFLFHMVWEANSRYIFSYAILLLPYGAAGLARCMDWFRACIRYPVYKGRQ
jgi:hypothetical protein